MDAVMVIDIGNSNIKIGIYEGATLLHHWRISTNAERTVDELGILVRGLVREAQWEAESLRGIIVSSVVPPILSTVERMCTQYFGLVPLVIGPGVRTGLDIKTENPREVGADRIVNAVAALHLYRPPLVIVDFGTATTFCVVDQAGHYIGGAIAPGVGIAAAALYETAAKLPRVELLKPRTVIGRNTVHSMQSGILFGFVGLVDGVVDRIKRELPLPYTVVGTGGFAVLLGPETRTIQHIQPLLTLEGLRILWERNRER